MSGLVVYLFVFLSGFFLGAWAYAIRAINLKVRRLKAADECEGIPAPAFDRRPGKMGGQWCFAGTRIPVAQIRRMVADGMTPERVCHYYPDLTPDLVRDAVAGHFPEHFADPGCS